MRERSSKSLVDFLLHFGCFNVTPDHSFGEKRSSKHCAILQSFSLHEKTIAEEVGSWLEASLGIVRLPTIVLHHYQVVAAYV